MPVTSGSIQIWRKCVLPAWSSLYSLCSTPCPALMRWTSPGTMVEPVPHGVLVGKRALEHVADDLHVAVPVAAEARARGDAILVDDAQRPEPHVPRVLVAGEGEAVVRVEPAVVGMAALGGGSQFGHGPDARWEFPATWRHFMADQAWSSPLPAAASRCR